MSEADPTQTTDPAPDDDNLDLVGLESTTNEKGQRMVIVPVDTIAGLRKDNRTQKAKIKELEPIAAGASDLRQKLEDATPFINAIANNPRLRAEALRATGHTRTSADTTEQPDDDPEATQWAELNNLYLTDGVTLDVARAKRSMDLLDKRNERSTTRAIQPYASVTLGGRAEQNLKDAIAMVDEDGVPLASEQSIREVAKNIGRELLADPEVIDKVLINNAIGLDRRNKRTPQAPIEPLHFEGVRRGGPRDAVIDPETKARLARMGLSEKDYADSTKRLEHGVSTRTGISLGGK